MQIERYASRISGPLRDRIDLVVEVPAAAGVVVTGNAPAEEPSGAIRARVLEARQQQAHRFKERRAKLNAEMDPSSLRKHCALGARVIRLLETASQRFRLSARGYDRVLKVTRTIADLAGADGIEACHLAEALQYRMVE